jgi:hypothetical protein
MIADCLRKAPQIPPFHLLPVIAATDTQDPDVVDASVRRIRALAPRFKSRDATIMQVIDCTS